MIAAICRSWKLASPKKNTTYVLRVLNPLRTPYFLQVWQTVGSVMCTSVDAVHDAVYP